MIVFGLVVVLGRIKQTSDDAGPAEPGPQRITAVQNSTTDAQVTVTVEETHVVTEHMVVDSDPARSTERPVEVDSALQTSHDDTQPESAVQDRSLMLDVVSTVVDAVNTAFAQTTSESGSPGPTQNQDQDRDRDQTPLQATQGEEQDSFLLADDDEMEARMIAEQRRARAEGGNKRLSTLSERMVNDLIFEDEGEVSARSGMEVERGQEGGSEQARRVDDADGAGEDEEVGAPTGMADQTTPVPAPAPVPAVDDTRSPPTPIEQAQQDPRRRATSSALSTTSRRRPVQTPERAAHILAKTTKKFGIDVRTVLTAMQYVVENDGEGQIPVPELWRLLEEDRVAGWGRFGSGTSSGGKRKA